MVGMDGVMAYLWINAVDHVDGLINLASVDGSSHSHAVSDGFGIERLGDVGLLCKLCGGARIAFRDEVVHDNPVDITATKGVSTTLCLCKRPTQPGLLSELGQTDEMLKVLRVRHQRYN